MPQCLSAVQHFCYGIQVQAGAGEAWHSITTPLEVNLDLLCHSGRGESGCIQGASRSSAGAAASRAQDRGNQVLPAGPVELLGLDCFLCTKRMLSLLLPGKAARPGLQPAGWQQLGSL